VLGFDSGDRVAPEGEAQRRLRWSRVAYLPADAVGQDLAAGTLEAVMAKHVTRGPGFYLYFPARTQEQPKLRALIDVIGARRSSWLAREAHA
jgi:DNA-binding transcriptional LysR family regulator